jgi:hypothetical protein
MRRAGKAIRFVPQRVSRLARLVTSLLLGLLTPLLCGCVLAGLPVERSLVMEHAMALEKAKELSRKADGA